MAVVVRTRRLSNPSRKRNAGLSRLRRRGEYMSAQARYKVRSKLGRGGYTFSKRNPSSLGKKRMSLKQKLHFGTLRQRAAARLALRNPRKRAKVSPSHAKYMRTRSKGDGTKLGYPKRRKTPRVKNVGEIVSISLAGLGNPGKRKRNKGMAKRRRARRVNTGGYKRLRKSNPTRVRTYRRRRHVASGHRRRRTNPVMRSMRRRRRNPGTYVMRRINRGRRRNPGLLGLTGGAVGDALGVIGGMIGSKYITQLALGGNNTSYMGYAGNLVASLGLGWAAGKVTKNKNFGTMVMIGGIGALILRILQDNTPIGQYVNLSLAGMGKAGDLGLGIIQDSSFPVPQTFTPGSMTQGVVPRATRQYVSSALAAQTAQMSTAGGKGMGSMRGRARRAIM